MPSSLTRDHSCTLGSSPRLPVSVSGTGTQTSLLVAFLGSLITVSLWAKPSRSCLSVLCERICLLAPPIHLDRLSSVRLTCHSCVTTSIKQCFGGTGLFNLFPIAYASQPQLRARLTLRRLTLLRNPWTFGVEVSHLY